MCFDTCKLTLSTSNVISTRSLVCNVSATKKKLPGVLSNFSGVLRAFKDRKLPGDCFTLLAELVRLRKLRLDELKEQAQLKSRLQSSGGGSLNTVLDSSLLVSLGTLC